MATKEQVEEKYRAHRQQVEDAYREKLQELAKGSPEILNDIRYEGKSNAEIEKAIKRDLADDLDRLAYDKAREMGEVEE